MTAVTTVIGLAPLAVGSSDGALLQRPMAITIMAGLSVATFFTLVVLPILYVRTEAK
jgi:HAE1 family hydrophobic/amphiphilic exporter-1